MYFYVKINNIVFAYFVIYVWWEFPKTCQYSFLLLIFISSLAKCLYGWMSIPANIFCFRSILWLFLSTWLKDLTISPFTEKPIPRFIFLSFVPTLHCGQKITTVSVSVLVAINSQTKQQPNVLVLHRNKPEATRRSRVSNFRASLWDSEISHYWKEICIRNPLVLWFICQDYAFVLHLEITARKIDVLVNFAKFCLGRN